MGLQSALATLEMAENMKNGLGVFLLASLQAYAVLSQEPRSALFKEIVGILGADISLPYKDDSLLREVMVRMVDDTKYQRALDAVHRSGLQLFAD
jgi:histidine ammonia-lyase